MYGVLRSSPLASVQTFEDNAGDQTKSRLSGSLRSSEIFWGCNARERTCLHLILVSQPPFTSHPPPPPEGEGEMSMASPPAHSTWAGVVKGQQPPTVSPGPSPPLSAHLLQLYKNCVARGTWARLIFETMGGEEELSFLCRVPAGAATTRAAYGA